MVMRFPEELVKIVEKPRHTEEEYKQWAIDGLANEHFFARDTDCYLFESERVVVLIHLNPSLPHVVEGDTVTVFSTPEETRINYNAMKRILTEQAIYNFLFPMAE